ncbi:hypothetical protein [Kamptonema sp. UHCC 0994]|uniref:hypothetical protein n=1 Tax=Kamptonema sp. UHCC 0994 TaxID=3031329 RepID=UPI0023BA7A41|nr:hypothetical protein [Kamptonema sp. UHCC 0994]MDF0556169.1 hypothetical protein [Kamptonema sp. UHCC 0994]
MDSIIIYNYNIEPKSSLVNVSFSPDGKAIADLKDGKGYAWNFLDLDELLEQACDKAGNYLKNNPSVKEDKHLCDDVRVRSQPINSTQK